MAREVKDLWNRWVKDRGDVVLTLQRVNETQKYKVHLKQFIRGDGTRETFLSDGWSEFVNSNNLQIQDKILFSMYDMGEVSYRVRIWRNHNEITRGEPHALLEPLRFFKFMFLHSYIFKPTINIPLPFAREHFMGLKKFSTVNLYGTRVYEATMHIKYDRNKIVSCNIKRGLRKFIRGENVQVNEKAVVELIAMDPPFFSLIFT
ncbi:uncharacterized protein LOC110706235 [Chenopodium quinoa]|nr:uncharacterized protein LOC110706235 [Chenopodium quinoa]